MQNAKQEEYIKFEPPLPCVVCGKPATVALAEVASRYNVSTALEGNWVITPQCKECVAKMAKVYHID
jgi:hypothetical protein